VTGPLILADHADMIADGRFRRLVRVGFWLRALEEVKPSCFMVGNEKARGDFFSPFV
jgi:hypothetical protein